MNENLDLMTILDGCPKGTEFHSSIYGKIIFEGITCSPNDNFPIVFRDCQGGCVFLPKSGKYDYENAECIVFPSKEQRDWSKFERFWDKSKAERFDPKTLQPFDKVLAKDGFASKWTCSFFSHMDNDVSFPVYCSGGYFKVCIPYNEETKHLIGASDDCPEYYKWWKDE